MKMNIRQKKVVEAKENKIICLATAASGKAIPIDTVIPTPNGWKIADEIKVGDYLINELGQPTKVLGVYSQGKKEVYKITFGDGREAKCCKEHIWSVNKITWKDKNEYRDYTVAQLLEEGLVYKDRRAKFSIPCSLPIQWPEKEYDIDPYVIGAFLGDGCCIGKSQLVLASENEHIPLLCAEKMGTNVKTELWYNNKYQWRFYIENGIEKKYFNRLEYFKKYKKEILQYSYNKSIPQEYKIGSIEQRLSLIQGLMDTDGCIEKRSGHVSFTSTSFSLIKDVQEVLNSLGYVSRLFQEKRKELYIDTCYSLSINIPNKEKEKLFRLKRKKDIALTFSNITQKHDYSRTTIRSIEKTNELKEMVCFYVDNPKHLFLMNDCIVTHNTTVLTERIRYLVNNNVEPEKIAAISFTTMAADEMKERLGEQGYGMFIGTIHSLANNILIENGIDTTEIIKNEKFDTLLKKALTIPQKKIQTFEHVLVDEFQDISELEYNFIEHIPKKNIYLTGDERQCQPVGTKVMMRDGSEKNIENLVDGEYLMTYELADGGVRGGKKSTYEGGRIEKIAHRDVEEEIISITTEDNFTSKYTNNHICMVKLNGKSKLIHAVYLMCDDNYRFRIGKIPFFSVNSCHQNPWRDKMYKEGCSKIWILKLFDNDKDARVLETKLSYKYQIPQTCWQLDKVSWTKEDIDYIYEDLNTYENAKKCLKEFGRDIEYPLIDKNLEKSERIHFAKNAVAEIYACNLLEDVMDVIVFDETAKTRKHYSKITNISRSIEKTTVYSLQVANELYFADNILTHNCIYGFKGSSDKFLRDLYEDASYKVYYLVDNYRNPPNIIKFAEDLIGSLEKISPPSNPTKQFNGHIEKCSFYEALEEMEWSQDWANWYIICRTNNEVAAAMAILDRKGIPYVSFKRGDTDLVEMNSMLRDNRVKILTVHAMKGLEGKNVIAIGARLYNDEERRIAYVAATRAESSLYWCPSIAKRTKGGPTPADIKHSNDVMKKFSKKMVNFGG